VNWQTESDSALEAAKEPGGMSIGAVCEATGLSARTVRYYEELGLLPGVRRRTAGRRVYGDDELERLRFIQRLKTLGLSLSEVKELNSLYALAGSTHAMLERLDGVLGVHLKELDGRIAELIGLRDEMSKYRDHIASRLEQQDIPAAPED
jgi:DNA-binding transcriptional MerR regulator